MSIYSPKEVEKMTEMYTSNPCLETVDKISVLLNRTRKSVIAKLVKEGVYVTRGYRTKRGEVPITKLQLVYAIENHLDIKLPGLDKTPKDTLQVLEKAVRENVELLEETLSKLSKKDDVDRVLAEIESLTTNR